MEKFYVLQVLGTFHDVSAYSVAELQKKGAALKARYNLSGQTYRIFTGTRPIGSKVDFNLTFAKEAKFS